MQPLFALVGGMTHVFRFGSQENLQQPFKIQVVLASLY